MACDLAFMTEEAPFTAVILFRDSGRLLCMGSIVDEKHILTAKKCYERSDAGDLLVLVGYYKPYWGKWSQVKNVQKIIRHEGEIALLRLRNPIRFTNFVQPSRFPPAQTKRLKFNDVFKGPFHIVGFPVDRYDVPGDYLKKNKLYTVKEDDFVEFTDCQANYTKLILDEAKAFCTIGNASYCWGGLGGPVLSLMDKTNWIQVGIVVADNCTISTTGPLLAARTDVYGDWIRTNSFHGHQPK